MENTDSQQAPAEVRRSPSAELDDAMRSLGHDVADESRSEPRRKYRTVSEAWAEHETRLESAHAAEQGRAEADREYAERKHERRVKQASSLNAEEYAAVTQATRRAQEFQKAEQVAAWAAEQIRRNPQANTPQAQQWLAALQQEIEQRRGQVADGLSAIETLKKSKALERGRLELEKIDPELSQPEARERLVAFLKKQGIAESRARAVSDPSEIGHAWRLMRATEAREKAAATRAEVARRNAARGINTNPLRPHHYDDAAGARAALRASGSMRDALAYLLMSRDERELGGR